MCLVALRGSKINLPGRGPEFWLWAIQHEDITDSQAAVAYLEALKKGAELNSRVNKNAALWHGRAKQATAAAPVSAVVAVGTYLLIRGI